VTPTLLYTPDQNQAAQKFQTLCLLVEAAQGALPRKVDEFCLGLDAHGLCLLTPDFATPFRLSDTLLEDRIDGYALLSRACGATVSDLSILDPFAGFGIDGLTLALRGAAVTMIEANPLVFALLQDFVRRLDVNARVIHGDGAVYLNAQIWDVIYLDPMFPKRSKKALPNRGLQHLQALTAGAQPVAEKALIETACLSARRVVLKRRLRDPTIGRVDFQVAGKSVRFDVYT
jgi:16S rRNA (guanine1516-N2)-methyltransferase